MSPPHSAGLPAWFAIHHPSTTHSSHLIGAHISGHWPPWSQRHSLVAEGSLLVFCYYGIPEDIVSDWGPQFISKVWKAFFTLLGVTVSLSSGYHPQSNGQTERKIQEVGRFLGTFCHGHQNQLEPVLGLGGVCAELSSPAFHWTHPFPVHTRLPASSIPLVRRTIRCPIHRLLVPRERESLGRRSPSTTAGSAQA